VLRSVPVHLVAQLVPLLAVVFVKHAVLIITSVPGNACPRSLMDLFAWRTTNVQVVRVVVATAVTRRGYGQAVSTVTFGVSANNVMQDTRCVDILRKDKGSAFKG
jgi:hypothetical protein